MTRFTRRLGARALVPVLLTVVVSAACATPVHAASPAWRAVAVAAPTHIAPLSGGKIAVYATNIGGAPTSAPTTVTIGPLPPGIVVEHTRRSGSGHRHLRPRRYGGRAGVG